MIERLRLWAILLCLFAIFQITAFSTRNPSDGAEISFSRRCGFILGSRIQGQIDIHAKFPDAPNGFSLYLGNTKIMDAEGRSLTWALDTNQLSPGEYTLKIIGINSAGQPIEISRNVCILSRGDAFLYFGVIALTFLTAIAIFVRVTQY